jgi:serine/threonine kinase 16
MDFGSVSQARYMIMSRREALQLQVQKRLNSVLIVNKEYADSHCTPSFRAPELYDVASDALIDERTDIWVFRFFWQFVINVVVIRMYIVRFGILSISF